MMVICAETFVLETGSLQETPQILGYVPSSWLDIYPFIYLSLYLSVIIYLCLIYQESTCQSSLIYLSFYLSI